jgi:hypothetical protein
LSQASANDRLQDAGKVDEVPDYRIFESPLFDEDLDPECRRTPLHEASPEGREEIATIRGF